MEKRLDIQSFDYRTLQLVEEKYPKIHTFCLTSSPRLLDTDFAPANLRYAAMPSQNRNYRKLLCLAHARQDNRSNSPERIRDDYSRGLRWC
jgi:hypothetical protein